MCVFINLVNYDFEMDEVIEQEKNPCRSDTFYGHSMYDTAFSCEAANTFVHEEFIVVDN